MPDRHALAKPALDVADETYVAVSVNVLAPVVADPESWSRWWPDLRLEVTRGRGLKGQQWAVTGSVRGTMEIWLEPVAEGAVLHWFLRADPHPPASPRATRREQERRVLAWKAQVFALKDRLEGVKDAASPAEVP